MSWFKRPSPFREVQPQPQESLSSSSSPNMPSHKTPTGGSTVAAEFPAKPSTDSATCLMVYKNHWEQAVAIMSKASQRPGQRRTEQEDVEAIMHYVDQMMLLLIEEYAEDGGHGPVLNYSLTNDIFQKLYQWSKQTSEYSTRLKLHALKMYELLISQSQQMLLVHKPIIRPLLKLLVSCDCEQYRNTSVESQLIQVLHQLAVCLSRETQVLELLFNAGSDHGSTKFVMFSLLIPYVHKEGSIGQQARDAFLLIMALSAKHNDIGQYIAENSDFCPVLATGLSGRYSELPRKFDIPSDDWHQLTQDDIDTMPDLIMFLNSLEFCNAVVQVAHPLVKEQLLMYIYNGFLEPVLGPALHQNEIFYPSANKGRGSAAEVCDEWQEELSSMDEVIAATAYLELFIRRITEPALMRIFLKFLITGKHDGIIILESLITRINSGSRLCMVSLSLFNTLVDLHCEDVMFQLVFRYLIPCTHVMVSQRRSVRDVDMYGKTAEKLLSLTPTCCRTNSAGSLTDTPPEGACMSTSREPSSGGSSSTHPSNTPTTLPVSPPTGKAKKTKRYYFRRKPKPSPIQVFTPEAVAHSGVSYSEMSKVTDRSGSPISQSKCSYDNDYLQYLASARLAVQQCSVDTSEWSMPYDGENPSPDSFTLTTADTTITDTSDSSLAERLDSSTDDSFEKSKKGTDDASKRRVNSHADGATDGSVGKSHEATNDETSPGRVDRKDDELGLVTSNGKTPPAADGYPESVTSEADSALSGESSAADNLQVPSEDMLRNDSPMNDNFDNADFHAFLQTLRSVKTPVEFCEDIEASLNEMDSLIRDFENADVAAESCVESGQLPTFVTTNLHKETSVDARPRNSTCSKDDGDICDVRAADTKLSVKSDDVCSNTETNETAATEVSDKQADVVNNGTVGIDAGGAGDASVAGAKHVKTTGGREETALAFTPTKYKLSTPNIGPFLSTLLFKLEALMQNSLYVNLLCTGLIARLAAYPQPLLRSLLLNHTLVFQPTVKSLIQVISSVKHKVDCFAYSVNDFDKLMTKARSFLAWREGAITDPRAMGHNTPPPSIAAEAHPNKERRNTFGDFFSRRNSLTSMREWAKGRESPRRLLRESSGFRYINRPSRGSSPSPQPADTVAASRETLKTKNAVYCALILEEFTKELAAISQEHAVVNLSRTNLSH